MTRVLVVEDERALRETLAYNLRKAGFEVRLVEDGAGALATAQAQPPDLILLDVLLPNLDGPEVCRRLQADPATACIPIVFVTGTPTALTDGRLVGCAHRGILRKPIGFDELLASVEQYLTA